MDKVITVLQSSPEEYIPVKTLLGFPIGAFLAFRKHAERERERERDRQTERERDRQTERVMATLSAPSWHIVSMQC